MLRSGSSGKEVGRLQTLLNSKSKIAANLKVDNYFGFDTREAVIQFQRDHWLVHDGIVGPATWSTLEGRDKYVLLYNVKLVPQYTPTTCWSAALAMLLNKEATMMPGMAKLLPNYSLSNDSNLSGPVNTQKFADSYNLKLIHGMSWQASAMADLVQCYGPLMVDLLWNADKFITGKGSSGHMIIIAGIRGDGTEEGTTLRIYDPWPVGKGSKYSLTYGPFMRKMPAGTYQIFHNSFPLHSLKNG
jgi:hypothetical protein